MLKVFMHNNQCSGLIFIPKSPKHYLFKDFGPQSVGLRYSPSFFLLLSLCHLWQHVVNPTDRKRHIHTQQGNIVSEV